MKKKSIKKILLGGTVASSLFIFLGCSSNFSGFEEPTEAKYAVSLLENHDADVNVKNGSMNTNIPQDKNENTPVSGDVVVIQQPTSGTVSVYGDVVRYRPNTDYIGEDVVLVRAGDLEDPSTVINITINYTVKEDNTVVLAPVPTPAPEPVPPISESNQPPEFVDSPPSTILERGQDYFYQCEAIDPDGESLVYVLANKPSWLTFDSSNCILEGTTPALLSDYREVTLTAKDPRGATDNLVFSIEVYDPITETPVSTPTP